MEVDSWGAKDTTTALKYAQEDLTSELGVMAGGLPRKRLKSPIRAVPHGFVPVVLQSLISCEEYCPA